MKRLMVLLLVTGLCFSAFAIEDAIEKDIKQIHFELQKLKETYLKEKKEGVVDTSLELLKAIQVLCLATRGHIEKEIKKLKQEALVLGLGDWEAISEKWEGDKKSIPEIYKKIRYLQIKHNEVDILIKETEEINIKVLEEYRKTKKIIDFLKMKRLHLANIGFTGMATKKQKGTTTSMAWQPAIEIGAKIPLPKDWWAFSIKLMRTKERHTHIGTGFIIPILEPLMPAHRVGSWLELMIYQSFGERTSKTSAGIGIVMPTLNKWELAAGFGPRSTFWTALRYHFF